MNRDVKAILLPTPGRKKGCKVKCTIAGADKELVSTNFNEMVHFYSCVSVFGAVRVHRFECGFLYFKSSLLPIVQKYV